LGARAGDDRDTFAPAAGGGRAVDDAVGSRAAHDQKGTHWYGVRTSSVEPALTSEGPEVGSAVDADRIAHDRAAR